MLIALLFIKVGENLFDSIYLLEYGIPTDGRVLKKKILFKESVRHGFSNSRDAFEDYLISVEYKDSVGRKFSTELTVNKDLFSDIQENQMVKILYDKNSQARACLFEMRYQSFLMPAIAGLFGLVFGGGLWILKNRFANRLS
ncbi:hypothetical protein A1359_21345 [Methylomonas lenta]|uniref:DUF3592 domain-containing protein n=1 Tax=Methylomonas lenta TaxID=980561 RepID=A0A177NQ28_9GAMM|nr:hypothetical protein [Methylomonas lenta]OAI20177.1 hypothetical protein A1359_21345 [Methylomonas lenta]